MKRSACPPGARAGAAPGPVTAEADALPRRWQWRLWWAGLLLGLAALAGMSAQETLLQQAPLTPRGIVSFQMCAWQGRCAAIVQCWTPGQRGAAAFSLGLDYAFMAAYAAVLCLSLQLLRPRLPTALQGPTGVAAALAWLAGLADAVENACQAALVLAAATEAGTSPPDLPAAQACAALQAPGAAGPALQQALAQFAWPGTLAATLKFALLALLLAWLAAMALVAMAAWARTRPAGRGPGP